MLNLLKILSLVCVLSLTAASSVAADGDDHSAHGGDIQPWRAGAEIFTNSALFETDFGDLSGGAFATDDPGIAVKIENGGFTPGNWLRFRAVGQLMYWNGMQWNAAVPDGEKIEITDALNRTISFTASGASEITGVIGEIGSDGGLHEHLSFKITDEASTPNGTPGAYRIQLRLFESNANNDTSVSVAASPIAIVFNRGLTNEAYERAVTAAHDLTENAVYASASGILAIERVKALGTHYRVKLQQVGDNLFQLIEASEIAE